MLLASFALLLGLSPHLQEQPRQEERKRLLHLVSISHPERREKQLAILLKAFPGDSLVWEARVRRLPRPLLPLPDLQGGKIHRRKVEVFLGKKEGMTEREVLVYPPRNYDSKNKYPLLLAMHGSGGNAQNQVLQWRGLADRFQFIVVAGTGKGTERGYGFSDAERQAELSTLRYALIHLPIDSNRIFLGGTSRGGHLSWDLGLRFPDRWAGIAPMIGGPRLTTRFGQNNLRLLDNLWGVPILDLQGLKDDPGLLWNLRYAFETFRRNQAPNKIFFTFPQLGHRYDMSKAPWKAFFSSGLRNPLPQRILFRCSRRDQARSFWFRATRLDPRKVQDSVGIAISPRKWKRMNLEAKRVLFAKKALERTAKIEASWKRVHNNPQFRIRTRGVTHFELLLPKKLLPSDPKHKLLVHWNSSKKRLQGVLSARRFLLDWLERLDLETAPLLVLKWR